MVNKILAQFLCFNKPIPPIIISEIDEMKSLNRRKIREMVDETAKRLKEENLKHKG